MFQGRKQVKDQNTLIRFIDVKYIPTDYTTQNECV